MFALSPRISGLAFRVALSFAAILSVPMTGCDTPTSVRLSALSKPVDFSYACEGAGATVAPRIDESAADFNTTRICPDVASGKQGALFGVILNRFPASVTVTQLNPAAGTRRILDADFFVPGATGIPVAADPLRLLRAADWSAFYVVSAGIGEVTRVVVGGLADDSVAVTTERLVLPGAPTDAIIVGTQLIVAARDAAELWVVDIAGNDWTNNSPAIARVPLPDAVLELHTLDENLLVVWRNRPWLSRVARDGTVVESVGLVPACRNGLDDDGDGLVDRDDPDCLNRDDDDESVATGAARGVLPPLSTASFVGTPSCDNGIDDNGDGLTDAADPRCAGADRDLENKPACGNGIDDDGDGLTDLDDADCFSSEGHSEGPGAVDGPFSATFVDGGEFGRFVYVLDARLGEVLVFQVLAGQLVRVDVHADDAFPPDLTSVPFATPGAEPTASEALPAIRQPAWRHQRRLNIVIPSGNAFKLANSRVRGELWERLVPGATVPLDVGAGLWKPATCAPESPAGQCAQPARDDASWIVYGSSLDGRIQLFEAIRRGQPMHRLLQRQPDPARRTQDITAPRLTLRGRLINARGQPAPNYPFIGPASQEILAAAVPNTSPQRLRRYGIWPADDFEEVPNEGWTITYEGAIPRASGHVGRFIDAATFFDANQAFCEHGVAVGDWLQLEVPIEGSASTLHLDTAPTLADGRICPVLPPTTAIVEVPIIRVGMFEVEVDPTKLRRRPQLPALDLNAVRAAGLQVRLCQQALTALDEVLQRPEGLVTGGTLTPDDLPDRVRYRIRPNATWTVVGAASGFLHTNAWDRTKNLCTTKDAADPRIQGRLVEVPGAVARYNQCPPNNESLAFDRIETLTAGASRFSNPSFALDMFPACAATEAGVITGIPTQQETAFTFTVTGPQAGSALSVSDSMLQARVPLIESRRHQVQLDAGRNRFSVLQLRFGDLKEIITLE